SLKNTMVMKTITFETMIGALPQMNDISQLLGLNSQSNISLATIAAVLNKGGIIRVETIIKSGKEYEIKNSSKGGLLFIQNASIEHDISLILFFASGGNYVVYPSKGVSVNTNETSDKLVVYRKTINGELYVKNNSNFDRTAFVCFISIK
ncbi:hypothetical protein, partial [Bacteroides faecichinchillae]